MKLRTTYICPPIPERRYDWTAIDEETYDGPGSPIGYGHTEGEAILDLYQCLEEREGRGND
jgi:hypothetical protein